MNTNIQSMGSVSPGFFKWVNRVVTLLEYLALIALWGMAFLLLFDILVRYVFDRSSDWSLDVVQLIQVTLAFAAAAPVLRAGGHINMEALPAILSAGARRKLDMIGSFICAVGCFYMVGIMWRAAMRSYEMTEYAYAVSIPLAPWKFFIVVSFFILALQFFKSFMGNLKGGAA